MIPTAITMTVLTHPLQVLLMGMILFRCVRSAISTVVEARRQGTGSPPVAAPSHLRAA